VSLFLLPCVLPRHRHPESIQVTSELLFECYGAPSVAYAVDSLLSLSRNSPAASRRDGLVVSFNTASTSVIPVLDGAGVLSQAKRLEIYRLGWDALHWLRLIPQLDSPGEGHKLQNSCLS
jgi:actin-related protein